MSSVTKIEDIKEAIHRMDLLVRPYVVFMHPDMYEEVKKIYPNMEEEYQVEVFPWLDKDKAYLMKREELEEWAKPRFYGLFHEQQGENTDGNSSEL